ncbi:MAG: hypothetical protein DRJ64_01395 [Thermoprotei archaeon]|nr:MAG: hypothetical protein DRJ64_01395 [Thermoprotei archaeon]
MNKMVLNYIIGLVLMIVFAYINAYYTQYSSLLIIAYFVVMGAIMFIFTGRSASKMLREIEEVRTGNVLVRVDKEGGEKIKLKDIRILSEELKEQGKLTLVSLATFGIVFVFFFIIPRGFFLSIAQMLTTDMNTAVFISYIFFYLLLYLLSISSSLITWFYSKKQKGFLMVPSTYIVTDRGIVVDRRMSIKFPLDKSKIILDSKRKYVEISVSSSQAGATMESRIRLYYLKPKELYDIIMRHCLSEESG